jgi:hypothetical protein
MAKSQRTLGDPPPHRGRVQAQGGGTEKSVPWAQRSAPTVSDVLRMLENLEGQLTPSEKRAREEGFRQARVFVRGVPRPGLSAGTKKSFPRANPGNIRVDIEVQAGLACVPDAPRREVGDGGVPVPPIP